MFKNIYIVSIFKLLLIDKKWLTKSMWSRILSPLVWFIFVLVFVIFIFMVLICFDIVSLSVVLVNLKLIMWTTQALNLQRSSCLYLLSCKISVNGHDAYLAHFFIQVLVIHSRSYLTSTFWGAQWVSLLSFCPSPSLFFQIFDFLVVFRGTVPSM